MAAPAGETPGVKLYNAGAEHFKRQELDQAIDCFKRAADADPKLYRAWAYLGMAYAQQGQLDPAIEAYRSASTSPRVPKAFNNVGGSAAAREHSTTAMVFKMATEIQPRSRTTSTTSASPVEIRMSNDRGLHHAVALDGNDYEYATELARVQFTGDYEARSTPSPVLWRTRARPGGGAGASPESPRRLEQLKAAVPTGGTRRPPRRPRRRGRERQDQNGRSHSSTGTE
jgi:hypothetical protein